MPWEDPVGLIDIAEIAGVEHTTVKQWRKRHDETSKTPFPPPRKEASGIPLWDRPDVEEWLRATGRLTD